MKMSVVLYQNFTALDVFGPVEVLSHIDGMEICYVSLNGGIVTNTQGIQIQTCPMAQINHCDLVLVPGGMGSRVVVHDEPFIESLKVLLGRADDQLAVCTGSALIAKTGFLDHRRATSNKIAFEWVKSCGPKVLWDRPARWVADGTIYTSAGVSAGTDMALGYVRDRFGINEAERIAKLIEYHWHKESDQDIF